MERSLLQGLLIASRSKWRQLGERQNFTSSHYVEIFSPRYRKLFKVIIVFITPNLQDGRRCYINPCHKQKQITWGVRYSCAYLPTWPKQLTKYTILLLYDVTDKNKITLHFAFKPWPEKSKQLSDPQLRPLHYIWERDGQDLISTLVIGPRGRKIRGSFFITAFKNGCLLRSRMDRQSCKVSANLNFLKIARKYFQTAFFPTRARTSLHRAIPWLY